MKDRIKLDTPSIMFTSLSTKNWGRTFGFSARLTNGDIVPELIKQACRDVAPFYPHIFSNLRKGFFWFYQVNSGSEINIYEKSRRTIKPISLRYDGKPDFRFTYSGNKLNFEAAHCLGDGNGLLRFFEAVIVRYSKLKNGETAPFVPKYSVEEITENAFDRYYIKNGEKPSGKTEKAYHLPEIFEGDLPELVFMSAKVDRIKEKAHLRNMTVTEYLSAVLIAGIIRNEKEPINKPVTVFVPVNLRRFFPSNTMRNFVIQTEIKFYPEGKKDYSLDFICEKTVKRLKKQLNEKNLQAIINKFSSLANNPVIGIVPNCIKVPVMRKMQKNAHNSATTIFTNLGQCILPEELSDIISDLRFINGDTRYYGLTSTVSCVSCGNTLNLCWSQANSDKSWLECCRDILVEDGIEVSEPEE